MNVKCRFVVAVCLSLGLATSAVAASKQPIRKLTHDPNVPAVELFDAMEKGLVETTVIAKNSHEASVFVTNKSDAPVSVQFPKAVVAVQVLKQLGFPQRNNGIGNGPGGGGNGPGGGQSQSIGGGAGQGMGMGQNQGMQNNGGNGFQGGNGNGIGFGVFSVPSQKTVQLPLTTVCLAHGKPEPRARMKYRLVKLEDYSNDPVLHETLKLFVAGAADTETAQAAVWHLTDKMSWDDLHNKQIDRIGHEPLPYFGDGKVAAARDLIDKAKGNVKDQGTERKVETAARRPE
ncbi:MAG: hypothetical protein HY290_28375 [Planctomycetia bacterium]|nr:hypothetical protein [Planctomycetia bacterium]